MRPIAPLITDFLRVHLPIERGYSTHTCEGYAYAFQLWFTFVSKRLKVTPSQLNLEQLDSSMVLQFLAHIEAVRKNSVRTRNTRLAAIKAFMRFVEFKVPSALEQVRQIMAIPTKRFDQPLLQHLVMGEVTAILDAPNIRTRLGLRDRAMLHLCFAAGLRVSELVSLPLAALTLGQTSTISVMGKGRKQRCLPLWKETTADLRAWLSVRGGHLQVPELFVNARGSTMSRAGFEYVLKKHTRTAALSCNSLKGRKVSPHQLRHSCALLMLQATGDIRKVALWLGHSDIRTTELYLRIDPTKKLEAIEAAIPPGLRKGRFKAPDKLIASLRDV